MEAAWTTAALGRAKKMTPLKDLLSGKAGKAKVKAAPTPWQSMYAMAASWAASHGEIRTEGAAG